MDMLDLLQLADVPGGGHNCGGRGDQGGQLQGLIGGCEDEPEAQVDAMLERSDYEFSLSKRVDDNFDNHSNDSFAVEMKYNLFTILTSSF